LFPLFLSVSKQTSQQRKKIQANKQKVQGLTDEERRLVRRQKKREKKIVLRFPPKSAKTCPRLTTLAGAAVWWQQ
jgi:hypothetical protein